MNALVFSLLASACAALSSLFFRKNVDTTKISPTGYLVFFYLTAFILSFTVFPEIWSYKVNYIFLGIGALVGIISSLLMQLTSRALERGPAGLTYAFQNASAVFPGILLFLILGTEWGYSCSYLQLSGLIIVLFGLFLGTKKDFTTYDWLKYAIVCFLLQILALTFIEARCLLFQTCPIEFTLTEADDVWFMPGLFGSSFLIQLGIFINEKRWIQKSELILGCSGGLTNFLSTLLLLLATKYAMSFEKGVLFPCFAVSTMILCNIWANRLYSEKFNFKSNTLCSIGIFMAVSG